MAEETPGITVTGGPAAAQACHSSPPAEDEGTALEPYHRLAGRRALKEHLADLFLQGRRASRNLGDAGPGDL
jgi:hypothetical protein